MAQGSGVHPCNRCRVAAHRYGTCRSYVILARNQLHGSGSPAGPESKEPSVRVLLDTLEYLEDGVRDAWIQETLDRLTAFDCGEVQPIEASAVFERARGMVR